MAKRAQRLGLGILLGVIPGLVMLVVLALFMPDAIIEWAVAFLLIAVGAIIGGIFGWRGRQPPPSHPSHP
jgi:TctA family transporter